MLCSVSLEVIRPLISSPDQWKLAEMLIPTLRDLEETIRELSGERYATLSMVLPLMHFLHSELAPRTGEKPAVRSLKTELQKQLRTRFELEEHDMSSLRVLAATLDPRFRHISFLKDDEKEELQSVLKDLCATRLGAEDESVIDHSCDKTDDEPPSHAERAGILSRMYQSCRSSESTASTESTIDYKIRNYLKGAPASETTDPLLWRKSNVATFPHLAKLAKRYLAVPATSTKSERTYSAAGVVTGHQRAALPSDNVDRIVFLNKNTDFGVSMAEEDLASDKDQEELQALPVLPQLQK